MKVVGLTGGIGSGKTTVAKMFKELGVPVFIADKEAKNIMNTSKEVRKEIIKLLGNQAYNKELPDRKFIASKVFRNEELLQKLNKIIHPRVHERFFLWRDEQDSDYVLYEAAILFESGGERYCDYTVLVTAPKSERINRVVKRDNTDAQSVEERMKRQWSERKKMKRATFIIENRNLTDTAHRVRKLHRQFLKLIST